MTSRRPATSTSVAMLIVPPTLPRSTTRNRPGSRLKPCGSRYTSDCDSNSYQWVIKRAVARNGYIEGTNAGDPTRVEPLAGCPKGGPIRASEGMKTQAPSRGHRPGSARRTSIDSPVGPAAGAEQTSRSTAMGMDDIINKAKGLLGGASAKADESAPSAAAGDTAAASAEAKEAGGLVDKAKALLTDENIDKVAGVIKDKTPDNVDKVVDTVA